MSQLDTPITNVVRNLRSAGLRPSDSLTQQILAYGEAAVGPLRELALDTSLLGQSEPASLGPLHALRLLGDLHPPAMVEPLLRAMPLPDDLPQTQATYLWEQEAPQIAARGGASIMPDVLQIADDDGADVDQRGAAWETLAYLSATTPDLRDQVVEAALERLERESNSTVRGYIVQALASMGAKAAYTPVMAAYRTGRVDRDVISAAEARQMLLGTVAQRRTECANHTLAERYEQHGPYSEEQRQAMAELQRMQDDGEYY